MKFKRAISVLTISFLLCSCIASAEAFRRNYRKDGSSSAALTNRRGANDFVFEDFTSAAPGSIPSGIVVDSKNEFGYTTSGLVDIGGVEKNCMLLVDTKNTQDYRGPAFSVNCQPTKGLVGIETRVKFIKDEIPSANDWASILFYPKGSDGQITRMYVGSGTGRMVIHNGASAQSEFSSTAVKPEEWWTVKFVIDTENQKVDVQALHEPTGDLFQSFDQDYYPNNVAKDVVGITIQTQVHSGTWVVDYVRFSKENTRLQDKSQSEDFERGCPQTLVKGPVSDAVFGRTNITVDGVYKYTTKEPKVTDGNVLVTAKNIATFLDLAYYSDGDSIVMKNDDTEFIIAGDASGIKMNGKPLSLSSMLVSEDKQIFVPVKDIAEALGYSYEYDEAKDIAKITSAESLETEEDKQESEEAEE